MIDQTCLWYLSIYSWRDIVEIMFLTSLIYYISLWLKQDFQKPLLLYFYSYFALFFVTHYLHLNTVSSGLLLFAPVCALIFILLHQDTLQRNFITLHALTPSPKIQEDWVEALIRSSLIAVSNNKEIRCLIQKKDALATMLACPVHLETPLNSALLDLIIESTTFNSNALLWLSSDGTIHGINCTWRKTSVEAWLAQEVKEQEPWLQDALFFTSKTDALFFVITPTSRTCTLIAQGKIMEHVSAHATLKTIKSYLGLLRPEKKGDLHVHKRTTDSLEQSLS